MIITDALHENNEGYMRINPEIEMMIQEIHSKINIPLERIVLAKELKSIVGFGIDTAKKLEETGDFPDRRQITPGLIGYLYSELMEWINTRSKVKNDN